MKWKYSLYCPRILISVLIVMALFKFDEVPYM